jgi:hypothetical protein
MDLLRKLIMERTRETGCTGPWVLDVYYYLIGHGASRDDAVKAMTFFVDDIIAIKRMRQVERQ